MKKSEVNGIILLGIISFIIVTHAHAESTYLECQTTNNEKEVRSFSVKIYEGSISHTEPGRSFHTKSFFSGNSIFYIYNPDDYWMATYIIDRTTLDVAYARALETTGQIFEHSIETGSCKVVEFKDRKF